MYRRHDHVMRDFCTGIERALEAGWIDTQLAAALAAAKPQAE